MGLIGTRSLQTEIPGIQELVNEAEDRIRSGLVAYDALMTIRAEKGQVPQDVVQTFEEHSDDLGFAWLLKRYQEDPRKATEAQIRSAANDTVPPVGLLFWSFRIMVGLGFLFIATMTYFFIHASVKGMRFPKWALRLAVVMIPAPWIAAELGWVVAEVGRQPWTVDGILPPALSVSRLGVTDLVITLVGFVVFYSVLFVIEMGLMLKYIRKGPYLDTKATQDWFKRREELKAARIASDKAEALL